LRSAAHRRETYTGNWLPEPVVTGFEGNDPLSAVVAAEDARFAAMVVLERLTPDQRVAFVLHDGFAMPFAEVAEVLGTNEAAARQLASRARKAVAAAPPPEPDPSHNEVVGKLMAALAAGDVEGVVALLHPDVIFTGDSNGKAPTAVHIIHGADKVVRFMFGLAQRYGPSMITASELGLVNGELGFYTAGCPATDGYREMLPRITAFTVRDGKVVALWDIANPDKFTGSPLRST
jgi:RNA polymerase sigma-70 factor (ECF subfamily)